MGSLIARTLLGLAGDNTPFAPSTPVEVGTSGTHHSVADTNSWQILIIMLFLVVVIGAAVLMYTVRQRSRLLERRRARRMAEAHAIAHHAAHHTPHHTRPARPPGPERVT